MSIKITIGKKPRIQYFHQLAIEQPFKDEDGYLCIKSHYSGLIRLANNEGHTCSGYGEDVPGHMEVEPLPIISNWVF